MNQIALFLKLVKEFVEENGFILVERDESLRFLADYGMSIDELKHIILTLKPENVFDGPEVDRDDRYKQWTVAECAPFYNGKHLYLKLSIRTDVCRCKCLSIKLFKDRRC